MTSPRTARRLVATFVLLTISTVASAANTVHLFLNINGSDIQGESSETTLGREDSIECYSFAMGVEREEIGARTYEPIVIRKRIDKSSPLLMKALVLNEPATAEFRFYRRDRNSGETVQYHTIKLQNVRITSYQHSSPSTLDPANTELPDLEEVAFTFQAIEVVYTEGGITFVDEVSPAVKEQDTLTVK